MGILPPPIQTLLATGPLALSDVVAPYMAVFFAAFAVSFALTPLMRRLAVRNGVVDWPDLNRKQHRQPIAYLGGIAIFLGWLAAVALCFVLPADGGWLWGSVGSVAFPMSIVLGAAAITLTGLFDDVYGVSPRIKVAGQLFAAAALAGDTLGLQLVGRSLEGMGIHADPWTIYILGTAAIAAFVIGGCNAVNLLDGLDGLASGVVAIAAAGFLAIAAVVAVDAAESGSREAILHAITDPKRIVMCLAMLGALLGFLPYNFNPATIFMGDAGSLLLGFLSVSAILLFAESPDRCLLLVAAALMSFALPIADTSLAIFRRKMSGQSIFSPDSRHMHHLLRRSGLSVRQSVAVMYAMGLIFASLGVAMAAFEAHWRTVLAAFAVVYGFLVVTSYKYGVRLAAAEARRQAEAAAPSASALGDAVAGNGTNGSLAKAPGGSNMPARPSAGA